jgi:hypothetical protein
MNNGVLVAPGFFCMKAVSAAVRRPGFAPGRTGEDPLELRAFAMP